MTEERLKKANELLERIKEYQKEIASALIYDPTPNSRS